MVEVYQAPLAKVSKTWHLSLPRDMCKDMSIEPGDTLCMFVAGGILHLVPEGEMETVRKQLELAGMRIDEGNES